MESFATTRDLVALAGPSLGEGAAVGTLDMLSAEGGQPNEHQYANLCARTQTSIKRVQCNNNKLSSFFQVSSLGKTFIHSRQQNLVTLACFKCCFSLKAVSTSPPHIPLCALCELQLTQCTFHSSTSHIPLCALCDLEPPTSVVSISIQPSHMVSHHHHIRFHTPVNCSTSTYPPRHNAPGMRYW